VASSLPAIVVSAGLRADLVVTGTRSAESMSETDRAWRFVCSAHRSLIKPALWGGYRNPATAVSARRQAGRHTRLPSTLLTRRCRITEVKIVGQSFSPVLTSEASRHKEISPVTVCQPTGIFKRGSTLYQNSDCGTDTLRVLAVDVFLIGALKRRYQACRPIIRKGLPETFSEAL
jgi:hypothetical protein